MHALGIYDQQVLHLTATFLHMENRNKRFMCQEVIAEANRITVKRAKTVPTHGGKSKMTNF